MTSSVHVGVDVGGTKVLAVELDDEGAVRSTVHRSVRAVRGTPAELEDALTDAVLAVAAGRGLAGVGVSAAALVDTAADRVRFCTHLPWRDDPVRARLAERWGTDVVLENDANCAAVAERDLGAARGQGSFLLVTLGTGIGGAIVVDGHLLRGAGGMAGEFGHMRVVEGGLPCPCGLHGCWEQYSSGNALRRLTAQQRPDLLDGPSVTAAALAGDAAARAAFTQVGRWLGVGLANLVAAFDPGLVVVGGGVSAAGDLLLGPARSALADSLYAAPWRTVPEVRLAATGPEAGAVGAALLSQRRG